MADHIDEQQAEHEVKGETGDPPAKRQKLTGVANKRSDLLASGKYSDFVIQCQGCAFKVHRAVLLGKSTYLDALMEGHFKEAEDGMANLSEDDPVLVAAALIWMYTGNYPFSDTIAADTDLRALADAQGITFVTQVAELFANPFTAHVKMYEIGDRFMIPALRQYAYDAIFPAICEVGADNLRNDDDFKRAVTYAYETEGAFEELKPLLAWATSYRIDYENRNYDTWDTFGEEIRGFGWALMKEHKRTHTKWTCDSNSKSQKGVKTSQCVIVQTGGGGFEWVPCKCGFRGFCSRTCKSIDLPSVLEYFCNECVNDSNVRCTGQYRTRNYTCRLQYDDQGRLTELVPSVLCSLAKGPQKFLLAG